MRIVIRLFIGLVIILGGLIGTIQFASESGEVIVLEVPEDNGGSSEVRLWVVDHDDDAWLRAGSASSSWFQALEASSEVSVTRDNIKRQYRALVVPEERATINELMSAKYGWREDFIGAVVGGRANAMPIRLEHLK